MKVAQLLGLWGHWWHQMCRDIDCLHHRSYGPISVFFQASGSWQSEGLFDQSFSIVPPVQALRGLPCLGFFSVVPCIRHIEGPPPHPRLGSYPIDWHVRHLKGHPGWGPSLLFGMSGTQRGPPGSVCQVFDRPASLIYCSAVHAGVWGERGYGDGSTHYV